MFEELKLKAKQKRLNRPLKMQKIIKEITVKL